MPEKNYIGRAVHKSMASMSKLDDDRVSGVLEANKDKDFVKRIVDYKNSPYISNSDGSRSSHRMAVEVTQDGEWIVFPTIVNQGGRLVQKRQDRESREAQDYAISSGEYISFGKNKEEALRFGEMDYKRFWPKSEGGTR